MIDVAYAPSFVRQFKLLEKDLKSEVIEKIELFKNEVSQKQLRVHKLKGRLRGRFSFSVNYRFRIVFNYLSDNEAVLLAIGDHEVYKT